MQDKIFITEDRLVWRMIKILEEITQHPEDTSLGASTVGHLHAIESILEPFHLPQPLQSALDVARDVHFPSQRRIWAQNLSVVSK